MRKRLWNLHTNNLGGQDDVKVAFKQWADLMAQNSDRIKSSQHGEGMMNPLCSIIEFQYNENTLSDLD